MNIFFMRIIDIGELLKEEFFAGEISSILQHPTYRFLEVRGRRCNGFLHIEEGTCLYRAQNEVLELRPGSLIYLPLHSQHQMQVTSETISFTRTNFTLRDKSGEMVLFSRGPLLVADKAPKECADAIHELTQLCLVEDNVIREKALFYQVLAGLVHPSETAYYGRIAPVVRYIREHFCEPIEVSQLAGDCFLSSAQFYRLFHKKMKQSPLEYRNALRMKRACILLREDEYSVGEIAAQLGFENIYYFSRAFRSLVGISPSAYRKKQNETENTEKIFSVPFSYQKQL